MRKHGVYNLVGLRLKRWRDYKIGQLVGPVGFRDLVVADADVVAFPGGVSRVADAAEQFR